MTDLGEVERIPIESREQWLGLRRQDITASDIAALYGVGYRSALQVWAEKVGKLPQQADSPLLRMGRWAEPMIFEALADKYPTLETRRAKIYLRSPKHRIGATLDALGLWRDPASTDQTGRPVEGAYRPGIIAINGKLVGAHAWKRNWCVDGETVYHGIHPPMGYEFQVLIEAMLAEAAYGEPCTAMLAPLVHDEWSADIHLVGVDRNPATELNFLERVKQFWFETDSGMHPQADVTKDSEALAKIYSEGVGEIDLRGDNRLPALFDERKRLGEVERDAKRRRDEIKVVFQERMGSAAFGVLADGRRVSLIPVRETIVPSYVRGAYRMLQLAKGSKR